MNLDAVNSQKPTSIGALWSFQSEDMHHVFFTTSIIPDYGITVQLSGPQSQLPRSQRECEKESVRTSIYGYFNTFKVQFFVCISKYTYLESDMYL